VGRGDSPISARSSCTILRFKYTCVPPSAAVALSRVRAISRWRAKTLIFPVHFCIFVSLGLGYVWKFCMVISHSPWHHVVFLSTHMSCTHWANGQIISNIANAALQLWWSVRWPRVSYSGCGSSFMRQSQGHIHAHGTSVCAHATSRVR
jgi:hypothetical protein